MATGALNKYSFKAVGEIHNDNTPLPINNVNFPPVGIKTPIELGNSADQLFKFHTDISKQVHDNFRNLIQTNHGERLGLYDFGANLDELTFELGTESGDTKAINRIRNAVSKYMPFVELDTFEPFIERTNNDHVAHIGVRVIYNIPKLGVTLRGIEVLLYTAG